LKGEYDERADMWSVGVVAYQLLSGNRPFWSKNPNEILRKVLKGKWRFEGKAWNFVSDEAKDFITKLLETNPEARLTAQTALLHPWLKKYEGVPLETKKALLQNLENFAYHNAFRRLTLQIVAYITPEDDIIRVRRVFRSIDEHHVGFLTRKDILKAIDETDYELSMDFDEFFERIDIDNNGRVEYNEFVAANLEGHDCVHERSLVRAFERLDCDNSGFITRANLRTILSEIVHDDTIDMMLKEAGFGPEASISLQTFKEICTTESGKVVGEKENNAGEKQTTPRDDQRLLPQ
jgi:calcium-dependent protein kinase